MKAFFLLLLVVGLAVPARAQFTRPTHIHPAAAPISSPLNYVPQAFDVLHYDVLLDLTQAPAKQTAGVCEIRIRWVDEPSSGPFYFHLRDLTVDSAFYNGEQLPVARKEEPTSPTFHYELTPPESARKGDTAIIRIVYGGTMTDELGGGTWGGVSSRNGTLFALGVGFANNYVSSTQHWLPCYDHPSDKATFAGRFRVKKDKAVASNGTVTVIPESDSTNIYAWMHNIQCATYLLTFAVDSYVPMEFPGETPPMVIYARPADTTATRVTFKLLPRMVRSFAERFGAYPFEKVGYVNTPVGAMEHQTMISFPTALSKIRDTVNPTGAHELAHQWFGDFVSPQDFRHAWLTEAFATFCESAWVEELGGYASYLESQQDKAENYMDAVSKSEGIFPLYDFPRKSPSSNYPSTIYQKGAAVVGMLRYELGDSIFFAGLRNYLATYAYSSATSEMLREKLEETAGRPLDWFFQQWVYGKGWPVLSINVATQPVGGGLNRVTLTMAQIQADSMPTFINLPVEIGFRAESGEIAYRLVKMNDRNETFVLDSIPHFASIVVNRGPSLRALLKATTVSGVDLHTADSGAVEFIVKPNPIKNSSVLTVEMKESGDCSGIQYELYDSAGRRLLVGRTDACTFPIPTSGFNSGVYVLRFKFHGVYYDVPVMIAR